MESISRDDLLAHRVLIKLGIIKAAKKESARELGAKVKANVNCFARIFGLRHTQTLLTTIISIADSLDVEIDIKDRENEISISDIENHALIYLSDRLFKNTILEESFVDSQIDDLRSFYLVAKLRAICDLKGFSYNGLYRASNYKISHTRVSTIFSLINTPGIRTFDVLCDAANVDIIIKSNGSVYDFSNYQDEINELISLRLSDAYTWKLRKAWDTRILNKGIPIFIAQKENENIPLSKDAEEMRQTLKESVDRIQKERIKEKEIYEKRRAFYRKHYIERKKENIELLKGELSDKVIAELKAIQKEREQWKKVKGKKQQTKKRERIVRKRKFYVSTKENNDTV